jgi:hypothetical protein
MAKLTYPQLKEGFSLSGTFLYSQQADAEGVAAMLGLQGTFHVVTDDGDYWMPGRDYAELVKRINSDLIQPDQAPIPKAHPVTERILQFKTYLALHT